MNNGALSRLLAFDLLEEVNQNGAYANLTLPKLLRESKLSRTDKAFATELGYGTIRMQGKYDFILGKLADRKISEIDPKLIDLIRLGAHQLFSMRVPVHAALNETVEVGKKVVGKSRSSFLNAILRKFSQIGNLDEFIDNEIDDPIELLEVKYSHPKWIVKAFYDRLKDWKEVEELLAANNLAAAPNLIAWPSLCEREELLAEGASEISFTKNGVVATKPPEEYLAIKENRAGVQDAGSQYLTEIFFSTKSSQNEQWLDLCAAPGGKAKYLYELLDRKNLLVNDLNPNRLRLMEKILPKDIVLNLDGQNPDGFGRKFDRILIDAPCTGLGALRRRPEARWRKSVTDLKELIKIQGNLIDSAVSLLNPGGILGYATCSPHILETKVAVADALNRHPNMSLLPIPDIAPQYKKGISPDGTMQLWTHLDGTDSMFLALLRRES